VLAALAILGSCAAATAAKKPDLAYRREVTALWSIDYWGWRPRGDYDIVPYHKEFVRILASCNINRHDLTMNVIYLADKATDLGNRRVTNLMLMRNITRRITWTGKARCEKTFHVAEAYAEAGKL
jgi:hypothetical protein